MRVHRNRNKATVVYSSTLTKRLIQPNSWCESRALQINGGRADTDQTTRKSGNQRWQWKGELLAKRNLNTNQVQHKSRQIHINDDRVQVLLDGYFGCIGFANYLKHISAWRKSTFTVFLFMGWPNAHEFKEAKVEKRWRCKDNRSIWDGIGRLIVLASKKDGSLRFFIDYRW